MHGETLKKTVQLVKSLELSKCSYMFFSFDWRNSVFWIQKKDRKAGSAMG